MGIYYWSRELVIFIMSDAEKIPQDQIDQAEPAQADPAQATDGDVADDEDIPKKKSMPKKLAKNFHKQMKKMAAKTEQTFQKMGKDMNDGLKKVKGQMNQNAESDSTSVSDGVSTRSRKSSRASSLHRGLQLHQIKDAFDQFGQKLASFSHKPEINLDDVFNAETDCTEGELYDEDDYVAEADWGESWPSFDNLIRLYPT